MMDLGPLQMALDGMQKYQACWYCHASDNTEPMESSAWKRQCIDRMPCIARERMRLDILVDSVLGR